MIDYALWEVIENGTTLPITQMVKGVMTVTPITSAEDKAQRRLEVKARSTLMMGIPNEHQLKFNSIKDAKKLLEAIEKRFGGNEDTKKTQRNLLKQQYENFTTSSSEMLDQTFDRLQKLLLRSLSPEWNAHAIVWRNKAELETMSVDDLYNNLKVYEPEVKGLSSSSSSTQNMAFVSSSNNNTSSSNEANNAAHGVTTASTRTIGFDKSKVECYNCHKRGHFARECKALRNQDNKNKEVSRRSVPMEITTSTALVSCDGLGGYDWSLESVEEKLKFYKKNKSVYVEKINGLKWDIQVGEITIRELRKKLEIVQKEKDGIQFNVDKFENASKSLNKIIECQIVDNCKKGLGYNAVPPPYTGNFIPPTPDLSFTGLDEFVNKPVIENSKAKSSEEEPKEVRKNDDALIIEEWMSDSQEENMSQTKTEKKIVKPSIAKKEFVKPKQQEKTARKMLIMFENIGQNTSVKEAPQRNWNNMMSQKLGSNFEMFNKACYVCGSFDHL
ncbi:ribonuclease H-like domain-containing protein [Tanacetum coccineum]